MDDDCFFADRNVDGASAAVGAHGVSVHGELDLATVPVLEDACAAGTDYGPGFVIDLRAMTFIDIAGIRSLARIHEFASAGEHQPVVAPSDSASVRRTMRLAVLNGWLPGGFTFLPTYRPFDPQRDGVRAATPGPTDV